MMFKVFFSFLFLLAFLAAPTSASAKILDCNMNGHVKIDGAPMNISISLDYAWFGYGKVKSGTYQYAVDMGASANGDLICDTENNFGEQECKPKNPDEILEAIIIKAKWGPAVKVYNQNPFGLMTCNSR